MKFIFSSILLFVGTVISAQPGPIKILRYFDDFSYLIENDSIDKRYYERLKYMPLIQNGKINVSLGGEIREQYQYFKNNNFGDLPPNIEDDKDGHLWHRVMAHADFQLGLDWRVFTQLNSTFAFDKNQITEIDENRLSLHQSFIEWRPQIGKGFFTRIGRQEFGQGTLLTIGPREGPNTRLSFDAALMGLEKKQHQLYTFIATPVIAKQGVFDDEHINEYVWTLYFVHHFKNNNLDLYYFGFNSEETAYNYQGGAENRHTLGTRWWKKAANAWDYSIESMYQFGTFNTLTISAFNFSADVFYKFKTGKTTLTPSITFNWITGDKSNTDNHLNTYNSLYSKPSFGLAAPIGPTNIINIRPSLEYNPQANIHIILSSYFMWRHSENDGTYTPGRTQIRPIPPQLFASDKREIGQQLSLEIWYLINVNWGFFLDAAYFIPGEFVQETGQGHPITYLSGKVSYKF